MHAVTAQQAQQIAIPEVILAAANSTGGAIGKTISPQSIAVAAAAVGLVGGEGTLFRFTLKHSVLLVVIVRLLTTAQTYMLPGTVS